MIPLNREELWNWGLIPELIEISGTTESELKLGVKLKIIADRLQIKGVSSVEIKIQLAELEVFGDTFEGATKMRVDRLYRAIHTKSEEKESRRERMSDQLDDKKLEKTDKEINQLKPSELKTRLYENTNELDSEILQKAADILFKEDISGALFLEMKMEDFKEMGLTFGCRTALVKYREKIVRKPDFLSAEITPGKFAWSSIEPNILEPERILRSGGRMSREEGELLSRPAAEIYGEVTDQDWDTPELPPVSEADSNPRKVSNRKRGSSIFQIPQSPGASASLLEIPTKNGLVGEPSAIGSTDEEDEKLQDTSDTLKTDDLLETVENYLELPSPKSSLNKVEKQNCEWEQKSDGRCVAMSAPGCRLSNVRRPLSQSFRIKYRSSSSQIPKMKPRPSETESFELPGDPKSSSKKSIRRTTLAKLRAQDKILKEGWYEKAHGHREKWKKIGWNARYGVLLDNGMLIYFAELPLEKRGMMGFKRTVDLSVLQKVTIQHGKNDWRIKIHSPTASPPTHLLRFACKQEMNEWRNLLLQVGGLIQPHEIGFKKNGN